MYGSLMTIPIKNIPPSTIPKGSLQFTKYTDQRTRKMIGPSHSLAVSANKNDVGKSILAKMYKACASCFYRSNETKNRFVNVINCGDEKIHHFYGATHHFYKASKRFDEPTKYFYGVIKCFDEPTKCFDGVIKCFDEPTKRFDGVKKCFDGPTKCFDGVIKCFEETKKLTIRA